MKNNYGVPEPVLLQNGKYRGQVMREGKRQLIYGSSLDDYYKKALIFKQYGLFDEPEKKPKPEPAADDVVVLGDLLYDYIKAKERVLAKTSVDQYWRIYDNIDNDLLECDVEVLDFQTLIDWLAEDRSPKTVKNYWGLIKSALTYAGYKEPIVSVPQVGESGGSFLDDREIKVFCDYIRGKPYEMAMLFALHSLRACETMALTKADIVNGYIHVTKESVKDRATGKFIIVRHTKTNKSYREIGIFIPRLLELIASAPDDGLLLPDVYQYRLSVLARRYCREAGVTECTYHDLRRTFASLCYFKHLPEKLILEMGGWSDNQMIHRVYVKLYDSERQKGKGLLWDYYADEEAPENPYK